MFPNVPNACELSSQLDTVSFESRDHSLNFFVSETALHTLWSPQSLNGTLLNSSVHHKDCREPVNLNEKISGKGKRSPKAWWGESKLPSQDAIQDSSKLSLPACLSSKLAHFVWFWVQHAPPLSLSELLLVLHDPAQDLFFAASINFLWVKATTSSCFSELSAHGSWKAH